METLIDIRNLQLSQKAKLCLCLQIGNQKTLHTDLLRSDNFTSFLQLVNMLQPTSLLRQGLLQIVIDCYSLSKQLNSKPVGNIKFPSSACNKSVVTNLFTTGL